MIAAKTSPPTTLACSEFRRLLRSYFRCHRSQRVCIASPSVTALTTERSGRG